MKKSILIILLFVLFVSAFTKAVTLNYWIWNPELRDKTQNLISKFEASHPNIKVELAQVLKERRIEKAYPGLYKIFL